MLKIKDNVDLKILIEKYGFILNRYGLEREAYKGSWHDLFIIDVETRTIFHEVEEIGYWNVDNELTLVHNYECLKDLIDDCLIEEVLEERKPYQCTR